MRSSANGSTLVAPARRVRGRVRAPGDKSISHRYAILAALAEGRTTITGYAPGADCAATLDALSKLGVPVAHQQDGVTSSGQRAIEIQGRGLRGLGRPAQPLDACNSGTTLRMLAGVMAAHPFDTTLTGDQSLRRRPMRRVIAPLERMGAVIESNDGRAPLVVHGQPLQGIAYEADTPSAQVKSAILLAGVQASGITRVREPVPTRDHTERALTAFGGGVERTLDTVAVTGGMPLVGQTLDVPGDISSAAFLAAAAAALEGSDVELIDVGLNPTRSAILDVLGRYGAQVDATITGTPHGEPRGTIRVRHGGAGRLVLGADEVPSLIDELPVLAALATHGGEIHVTGASELRVKESDRITALVAGLRALGADAEELPDGFHVSAGTRLSGGTADAAGDHRLAMAFAIAALGADKDSTIMGADAVAVSYPGFFEALGSLCG